MGTKQCPFCAEKIQSKAIKCRFCGSNLDSSAVKKRGKKHVPGWVVCLAIVGTIIYCVYKGLDEQPKKPTSPSSQKQSTSSKIEAWMIAEEFLKEHLKSPGTADFGGVLGGDYQRPETCVAKIGDDTYRVKGWVDSQNSFGATVRTDFSLMVKHNGDGNWILLQKPSMRC